MCKVKFFSLFVLLALLLSAGTSVVLADEPRPPIVDSPPGVAEGGPTQGFLTDEVTSDTSGKIKTSGAGVRSSPGVRGWSALGWNAIWAWGASKTEITAGDGHLYQLNVRSCIFTQVASNEDSQMSVGSKAGDKAYAESGKARRVGSSWAWLHGEHSVVRLNGPGVPSWSWWETTNIHHDF